MQNTKKKNIHVDIKRILLIFVVLRYETKANTYSEGPKKHVHFYYFAYIQIIKKKFLYLVIIRSLHC
jgi:hypothetical protein